MTTSSAIGPCSQFSARARMRADARLPHPRRPEQVRVVDPVVGQGPLEWLGDVLLADHVGEHVGSVPPIERERGGLSDVRLGEQFLILSVGDRRVEQLRIGIGGRRPVPGRDSARGSARGSGPRLPREHPCLGEDTTFRVTTP